MLKKVIGIISYFPDDKFQRKSRCNVLARTIQTCVKLFPGIDIMVIAQNWGDFNIVSESNSINILRYKKLGINGARQELRKQFLASNYDYLIMLDDDANIIGDSAEEYLREIDEHPDMVGVLRESKLTLFAISKKMYNIIALPNLSAENGDYFEDLWMTDVCEQYYPDDTFHFKQTSLTERTWEAGGAISTWWDHRKYNIGEMVNKTKKLVAEYKK